MHKLISQKKEIISLLLLVLMGTSLFAYGGMFSGEKKICLVKTKWFDIIYPERCEASASILYEKADEVYIEVTEKYGLSPAFRMPVVITPAVDQFNAFWTSVPYNHIAIYDTGSSASSELAVFSETLLSTFRHELTHAVTFNMKNGFWRGAGKIFGDCLAPGMFSVTTGMAEGATLVSESAGGEGRLNDEYAKHYVKQAKIEGSFPAYHDVSGAADVSPGGSPYYFNGAFHSWLGEKYGRQAYAEFWYRVVNGKNITIAGAFKKSFGIKLKKAWNLFVAEYDVPQVEANPVRAGLSQDFFEPENGDYSSLNNAGALYESLSAAKDKLIWMDRFGGRVFVAEAKGLKPCELFSHRGLTDVSLSNDGRFIAVSYLNDTYPTVQACVKIYDCKKGSFYSVKDKNLKNAAILATGQAYYLIAQKYLAQNYSIIIYKITLNEEGKGITGIESVTEIIQGRETNPYAFIPLEDGTFAWLKKERMNYSLCVSSIDGSLLKEFAFPAGMAVRSLSASNGVFYFSYAQKGTLPRLGLLNPTASELLLSETDISGGVFEPVFWNEKLVYTGQFYRQNRLLLLPEVKTDRVEPVALKTAEEKRPAMATSINHLDSKAYNPFSYLYRGILIPLGNYAPDFIGPDASGSSDLLAYRLGATYVTSAPWTSGVTDLYTLTAGWDIKSKSAGVSLTLNKGTETGLFQTQTDLKSEFNSEGWKHGGVSLMASSSLDFGRFSRITLSNKTNAFLGKEEVLFYSIEDIVTLGYSNVRRAGPGRFENKGFAISLSYGGRKDASLSDDSTVYVDVSALAAAAKLYIPHLLPFESKYGFTYNLPLTLGFRLLPAASDYGYVNFKRRVKNQLGRVVFDANVEALAFSMDIQKAIPGMTALYLNDFYLSAGYAATGTSGSANYGGFQTSKLGEYFKAVADGRGYYMDSVYIKTGLELTPNIGMAASPAYKINIYTIYSFSINSPQNLKPEERIKLTLGFNMNL